MLLLAQANCSYRHVNAPFSWRLRHRRRVPGLALASKHSAAAVSHAAAPPRGSSHGVASLCRAADSLERCAHGAPASNLGPEPSSPIGSSAAQAGCRHRLRRLRVQGTLRYSARIGPQPHARGGVAAAAVEWRTSLRHVAGAGAQQLNEDRDLKVKTYFRQVLRSAADTLHPSSLTHFC